MNLKTAATYLACFRAGRPVEKRVLKAVQVAGSDPALRAKLDAQIQFDEIIGGVIHSLEPPENLREKLAQCGGGAGTSGGPIRSQMLHPAMLSVLLGGVSMVGFLIWMELDRRTGFAGKESVERIVAVAGEMSGMELDPTHALAGELGDSFFMRGFEGFVLPPELAGMPAVGSRVFRQDGHLIAQLAVDPHDMLVYVFRASDFEVEPGKVAGWKPFTQGSWAAALKEKDGFCTVIAFQGDLAEMERFLAKLAP